VLAMTVVTATLTFGASLAALVSHPALYGWNFSYAFYAVQGWGAVPARWADPLLAHDRLVAATTGVDFPTVQIDGQTVPAMAAPTRPAVLWLAFARQLSAVPDPVVPVSSIVLAGVTALVLANVVAAFPGRQAARTPPAVLLRAE
jgi:hypothetical protein